MTDSDENGYIWAAAQLKPNALAKAQANLVQQGYRYFCPTRWETVRGGKQFKQQRKQLFPGYCFVQMNPESSDARKLNATYGISRLISFGGGKIAHVPDRLIEALQSRCDETGLLVETTLLAVGDDVRILAGPFAEFVGTIETISSAKRLWILFNFMGQPSRVEVPQQNLEKL